MRSCLCSLPHGVSPPALPLPSFAAPSSGRHGKGKSLRVPELEKWKLSLELSVSRPSLSVCLFLSLSLPIALLTGRKTPTYLLSLPPSLVLSLCLSVSLSVSLSFSLSLCLCLSVSVFLSVSLSLSFSPPLPSRCLSHVGTGFSVRVSSPWYDL